MAGRSKERIGRRSGTTNKAEEKTSPTRKKADGTEGRVAEGENHTTFHQSVKN